MFSTPKSASNDSRTASATRWYSAMVVAAARELAGRLSDHLAVLRGDRLPELVHHGGHAWVLGECRRVTGISRAR